MATKRSTRSQAANGLSREEACRVLQVATDADPELVTQAYGHLVRKCQTSGGRGAKKRLDELHQAYLTLDPTTENGASETPARASTSVEPISFAEFFAEVGRLIARISARWRGRLLEVTILLGTTAWLGFLALSSGADLLPTVVALAIAGAAIWAPWRRA